MLEGRETSVGGEVGGGIGGVKDRRARGRPEPWSKHCTPGESVRWPCEVVAAVQEAKRRTPALLAIYTRAALPASRVTRGCARRAPIGYLAPGSIAAAIDKLSLLERLSIGSWK